MVVRLLLLLLQVVASSGLLANSPAIHRLRPHGGFLQSPASPVRFTFAPEVKAGVIMQRFHLWVKSGEEVVFDREVESGVPSLELRLKPGRYRWGVQFFSSEGEASEEAEAEVAVAEESDVWDGVPWLGARAQLPWWLGGRDTNEFMMESFQVPGDASDKVELLVATLGFGYVLLNGKEISQDVLSYSGWTPTEARVLYRSYDVTSLLTDSRSASIFVGLGCGYRCDAKGKHRFPDYHSPGDRASDTVPKIFRLQLRVKGKIVLDSGSRGWLARLGPVTDDSVYDGVTFNPGAAGAWKPAVALPSGAGPKGAMVPATFEGVQITRRDPPVSINLIEEGLHVVDFGTNVAGVVSISVPMAATVVLKHGEILQHARLPDVRKPDPSRVYFGNLRSATATDRLILTEAIKDWWPRFTYHGFRYVEVHGYPGNLTADNIQRLVLHTAVEDKSRLTFSDEVLQAIHRGAKGSQRSNLMQVPTDCDQRDERLGWTGDASLSATSMLLHFHYASMAKDWLRSLAASMVNGALPDVVPYQRGGGNPADISWSAVFFELLWNLWKIEGDITPAAELWPQVMAHVGNLKEQYAKGKGGLKQIAEPYGDWCPPPMPAGGQPLERPSKGFAAAFSFVHSIGQVAQLGVAVGGSAAEDGRVAAAWHEELKEEFRTAFYNQSIQVFDKGYMINFVLPLALGVVPEDEKQAFVKGLLDHIEKNGGTWTGGIINNRWLFDVLHDHGAADVAHSMLTRKSYPSFGYMFFNEFENATENMWELPDAPFQGTTMNSRNHHMFSSVGAYLQRMAGLSVDMAARTVTATVAGSLQSVEASQSTAYGIASLRWAFTPSSQLEVQVRVPMGLQGLLYVPCSHTTFHLITAGQSLDLSSSPGILHSETSHGVLAIRLGPGTYHFAEQAAASDNIIV